MVKCTVVRMMRANGWQGGRRVKKVRITVADSAATRAPDLVDRKFAVDAPKRLLVADFTSVRLVTGCSSTSRSASAPTPGGSWAGPARRPSRPGSPSRRFAGPLPRGHVKPPIAGVDDPSLRCRVAVHVPATAVAPTSDEEALGLLGAKHSN